MAERSPRSSTLSRSRGATSGILLVLLGAWGAIAPFVGPYFNFAYTPDTSWHWTAARGWYQVLPGSVTFVAGLLLLLGRSRGVTTVGAWLGILAGAWFVIGPALSTELTLGSLGTPVGTSSGQRAGETLGLFSGLGAVIIFLAAAAFGRLSVVTVRDMRRAERREAERAEAEELAAREQAEREQAERDRAGYNQTGEQPGDQNGQWMGEHGWQSGRSGEPYDQHSDPGSNQPAQTQQLPPQHGYQQGPSSGSGYGEGQHAAQYGSPGYGRHDADVREGQGTGPSAGTGATAADQPPTATGNAGASEQPR